MAFFRTRFPWLAGLAILCALGLLGGAIAMGRRPLRADLRRQLARQDATIIAALLEKQLDDAGTREAADPLVAVLDAAVVPGLPGVITARLYSPEGMLFATLVGDANSPATSPALLQAAARGEVATGFNPGPPPRLELVLPLRTGSGESIGLAGLELDATGLAAEYTRLDRSLAEQGWRAFTALGGAMVLVLSFAFWRLERLHRMILERSARLERANRELSLAATTSAVGTVAAHLIHGLRNPLTALQQFVSQNGRTDAMDQADATATARRMQTMIDDVVRVLRDEQGLTAFEVGAGELCAELERRLRPLLAGRPLRIETRAPTGPPLDNRTANLALLVLENLVQNAAQAIRSSGLIRVDGRCQPGGAWSFRVSDDGGGLDPAVAGRLFTPQASTKPDGTGLGLALSRQLARHLGGDLRLEETGPGGTTFVLELAAPENEPVAAE